jgi:hypothetical protein
VALLAIVCLVVATPVGGQSTNTVQGEWRTLGPASGDVDRVNRTPVDTDLSFVLDGDADRLASHHRRATLVNAVEDAATDEGRFNVLSGELDRIDARVEELRSTQRASTGRYSSNEIGGSSLLDTMARIGSRARSIEARLVAIRATGREIESRAIVTRSNEIMVRSRSLQGTVREHVSAVHRAQQGPSLVYTESANRSFVLGSATEQDYVREVTMATYREDTGTPITLARAVSMVADSYPELYEKRQELEVGGSRRAGSYRIGIIGTGDFMTVFVDAGSRRVFREDRRVSLARLSLAVGPNSTASGYRLSVDHTYRGGPMQVTVLQPDGTSGDARIRVGDQPVGTTGEDGQLWAVAPRGPTVVEARINGTELSVPFTAPAPPPLNTTTG